MADRTKEFLEQAKTARARAAEAEGEFRAQWQCVAEMWELLARECSKVRNPRPQEDESP